jgi:predicted ATPase
VTRAGARLSYRQLSEGTLRALALVFYLLADDTALLLLEEPEIGVHRGLLVSLLELIRSESRRKQILVSTHSDFVLDFVQPENVFAVKLDARGRTTVRAFTESQSAKELAALRAYLRTEGSLGEYGRTFGLES